MSAYNHFPSTLLTNITRTPTTCVRLCALILCSTFVAPSRQGALCVERQIMVHEAIHLLRCQFGMSLFKDLFRGLYIHEFITPMVKKVWLVHYMRFYAIK